MGTIRLAAYIAGRGNAYEAWTKRNIVGKWIAGRITAFRIGQNHSVLAIDKRAAGWWSIEITDSLPGTLSCCIRSEKANGIASPLHTGSGKRNSRGRIGGVAGHRGSSSEASCCCRSESHVECCTLLWRQNLSCGDATYRISSARDTDVGDVASETSRFGEVHAR